jgi:hypothetical protein
MLTEYRGNSRKIKDKNEEEFYLELLHLSVLVCAGKSLTLDSPSSQVSWCVPKRRGRRRAACGEGEERKGSGERDRVLSYRTERERKKGEEEKKRRRGASGGEGKKKEKKKRENERREREGS